MAGIPAPLPDNEAERLRTLRRYQILDTEPEAAFDDIARLVAHICGTPTAMVSLLDDQRQWFKARVGMELPETPRDMERGAIQVKGKGQMTTYFLVGR